MPVVNVYATRRQAEVMQDTWGHLRAEPGTHAGTILIARSDHGEEIMLEHTFDLTGPWFFEEIHTFKDRLLDSKRDFDGFGLWKWEGVYVVRKLGRPGRFTGKLRPMRVQHRFPSKK